MTVFHKLFSPVGIALLIFVTHAISAKPFPDLTNFTFNEESPTGYRKKNQNACSFPQESPDGINPHTSVFIPVSCSILPFESRSVFLIDEYGHEVPADKDHEHNKTCYFIIRPNKKLSSIKYYTILYNKDKYNKNIKLPETVKNFLRERHMPIEHTEMVSMFPVMSEMYLVAPLLFLRNSSEARAFLKKDAERDRAFYTKGQMSFPSYQEGECILKMKNGFYIPSGEVISDFLVYTPTASKYLILLAPMPETNFRLIAEEWTPFLREMKAGLAGIITSDEIKTDMQHALWAARQSSFLKNIIKNKKYQGMKWIGYAATDQEALYHAVNPYLTKFVRHISSSFNCRGPIKQAIACEESKSYFSFQSIADFMASRPLTPALNKKKWIHVFTFPPYEDEKKEFIKFIKE